jgi:hypothetical protein
MYDVAPHRPTKGLGQKRNEEVLYKRTPCMSLCACPQLQVREGDLSATRRAEFGTFLRYTVWICPKLHYQTSCETLNRGFF